METLDLIVGGVIICAFICFILAFSSEDDL